MLAGAYPFLAAQPMDSGVPIGTDALTGQPFCFDPWALYAAGALTNPNVVLAGVIGHGKSALAKSLAIRSIAAGRQVYVPGDPKGEWGIVADAVAGTTLRLGPGLPLRINPLDVGEAARSTVLASITEILLGRALTPGEHAALDAALDTLRGHRATVPDLLTALTQPDPITARAEGSTVEQRALDGRDVVHGLRRLVRGDLAGMFDGHSTTRVDPEAPMVVLDLSRIDGDDTALAVAMTCAAGWLESAAQAPAPRPRWVIYDEGWRLLGSATQLRRMQAQFKLARATGTAHLLILHRLSDLDAVAAAGSQARALAEGLFADCSTRILYRQESDQLGAARAALALTDTDVAVVRELPKGVGHWIVGSRRIVVRHQLTPEEIRVIDTDAAMTRLPDLVRTVSQGEVMDSLRPEGARREDERHQRERRDAEQHSEHETSANHGDVLGGQQVGAGPSTERGAVFRAPAPTQEA